ncbi:MAG: SPOR domain-containing protein [Deltaproteobacteria bacterium]|nr:SPOR domain-containing protein [Deltaproteobacteria bacterium]
MNKRNLQQWELRLGLVQLVILLGVVTGSMACAFYIGFSSGRAVGFESALQTSLANAARLPIASENATTHEEPTTDVYAKLSQPAGFDSETKEAAGKELDVPLGSIKTTDAEPTGHESAAFLDEAESIAATDRGATKGGSAALGVDSVYRSNEAASKTAKTALGQTASEQSTQVARATESKKTLGSLLEEKAQPESKKVEVEKVASAALAKNSQTEIVKSQPVAKVETAKTETVKAAAVPEKTTAKAVSTTKEKNSSLVRDTLPSGWFAQIAAPKKMQDANALAGKLKASGFPVMIEVARVRGDEYYRVLVGPEQNRDRAQRLVGQLKRESYIQGDPFLRVVK